MSQPRRSGIGAWGCWQQCTPGVSLLHGCCFREGTGSSRSLLSHVPVCPQMLEQRRKLPPMVNDRALFTRAAPFYDKDDPFYHSPSQRIGSNFSPHAAKAAANLFEQFPPVGGRIVSWKAAMGLAWAGVQATLLEQHPLVGGRLGSYHPWDQLGQGCGGGLDTPQMVNRDGVQVHGSVAGFIGLQRAAGACCAPAIPTQRNARSRN